MGKFSRGDTELVNIIKEEMSRREITMNELARLTGVSLSTLYEVMGGRVAPRLDTMTVICSKLGMKLTVVRNENNDNNSEK